MAADLLDEPWSDPEYRLKHHDHIRDVLQAWTLTHTKEELFELGQLMHFPWAPVASPMGVLQSPQLKARGFFVKESQSENGPKLKYPGMPYQFSSSFSAKKSTRT